MIANYFMIVYQFHILPPSSIPLLEFSGIFFHFTDFTVLLSTLSTRLHLLAVRDVLLPVRLSVYNILSFMMSYISRISLYNLLYNLF